MIRYFKRVKDGKVLDLHIHREYNDYVSSVIYPSTKEELYYNFKDFIELDNVDEWLDEGLKEKIFNGDINIPKQR